MGAGEQGARTPRSRTHRHARTLTGPSRPRTIRARGAAGSRRLALVAGAALALTLAAAPEATPPATFEIWHGDTQRVGHLGEAQDDFNLLGHVEPWREIDTLTWALNQQAAVPLSYRAFRRLVADGDFNADIPIRRLRPGANTITLTARLRDGRTAAHTVTLHKGTGQASLPYSVRWDRIADPQQAGQYVDGRWTLTPAGVRTAQVGYDRIFLIGERTWQDYEVRASFVVHALAEGTRDAGVGLILRFAGHSVGGPEAFPSGQPKWGYRPFGAIGWLRWRGAAPLASPQQQYYPGADDRPADLGAFPFRTGVRYRVRFACRTLPDEADGRGVTEYSFRLWPDGGPEPAGWTWQRVQVSRNALRRGGVALLAHHVDATFGDVLVTPLP